jgi:hypothetical protein
VYSCRISLGLSGSAALSPPFARSGLLVSGRDLHPAAEIRVQRGAPVVGAGCAAGICRTSVNKRPRSLPPFFASVAAAILLAVVAGELAVVGVAVCYASSGRPWRRGEKLGAAFILFRSSCRWALYSASCCSPAPVVLAPWWRQPQLGMEAARRLFRERELFSGGLRRLAPLSRPDSKVVGQLLPLLRSGRAGSLLPSHPKWLRPRWCCGGRIRGDFVGILEKKGSLLHFCKGLVVIFSFLRAFL